MQGSISVLCGEGGAEEILFSCMQDNLLMQYGTNVPHSRGMSFKKIFELVFNSVERIIVVNCLP